MLTEKIGEVNDELKKTQLQLASSKEAASQQEYKLRDQLSERVSPSVSFPQLIGVDGLTSVCDSTSFPTTDEWKTSSYRIVATALQNHAAYNPKCRILG